MFKGIDHVQLAAPSGSEAAARAFFSGILGMKEIPKPENLRKRGGVWFQCGPQALHIGIHEPFEPATKAHPAFHVDDLESLRHTLHVHNVPTKDDEPLEGAKRFYADDPFGNRLEFLERI